MAFPALPFTLRTDGDLVRWAKRKDRFPYLGPEAVCALRSLRVRDSLTEQRATLKSLWPLVLTDALRSLKAKDPREVDPAKPDAALTRLHEASLGVAELREVLTAFAEFEGLLYGASPERYRDHISHPFRVWILGHALISRYIKWELLPADAPSGIRISPIEWQCMWAIAALCHDVGYPLKAVEGVNDRAQRALADLGVSTASVLRVGFSPQMLPFHDNMIRLLSSSLVSETPPPPAPRDTQYFTHLQNKYYLKYLKSFDKLDHGIVSALLISKAMVYFLESDLTHDALRPLASEDARQFLIRREILRAIAAHTCPDIYHLVFNTLSFMLYIVDELQCWGRPTLAEFREGRSEDPKTTAIVKEFRREHIFIELRCLQKPLAKEDRKWVVDRLDRLHRILRLAVGTSGRSTEPYLAFSIATHQGKRIAHFILREGKIQKRPRRWFKPARE